MSEVKQRLIVVCLAGMTPQIITETLYALTQKRGERVDEIRVITTIGGRDSLLKTLLDPEHGKFFAFCHDYGIDPSTIKFDETTITLLRTPDGRTLKDIRTREENDYAADQICEIVRELARDDNTRIHASAAGGRKTMSIYLTTAMQLFGRGFDRLSHVLVSEDFETHPDFFYIPPDPRELEIRDRQGNFIKKVSTADAEIHLADIPFIRLRGLRSDWLDRGGYSYGRLVEQAQKDLDLSESLHDLRIDLVRRVVSVAGFSVVLSKREMFFYLLFARLCREGRGFIRPSEINVEILDETFRAITSATGGERPLAEYDLVPGYDFLIGMLNDLEHNYEVFQKTFLQIRSRINRKLSEAGIRGLYLIEARGGYSETGYGITVAPDRVILG